MRTWLRRHVARGDNPPGRFSSRWNFSRPWEEWSPREEADWARWCLMEDGTTYDEADAELQAVTMLLQPQALTAWQRIASGAREPGSPDARREAA